MANRHRFLAFTLETERISLAGRRRPPAHAFTAWPRVLCIHTVDDALVHAVHMHASDFVALCATYTHVYAYNLANFEHACISAQLLYDRETARHATWQTLLYTRTLRPLMHWAASARLMSGDAKWPSMHAAYAELVPAVEKASLRRRLHPTPEGPPELPPIPPQLPAWAMLWALCVVQARRY